MPENPRQSPWIAEAVWARARELATVEKKPFGDDMAQLVHFYAGGVIDIDPSMIPNRDDTRGGHAIYPDPTDWMNAKERAQREHGVSGSVMMECLILRYGLGHVELKRTVDIVEVQALHKNRLQTTPTFRGLRGVNLEVAQALAAKSDQTERELAESIGCSGTTVGRAIEYLKRNELAESHQHPAGDVMWKLTPKAFQDSGKAEVRSMRRGWDVSVFRGLTGVNLKVAETLEKRPGQTITEIMTSTGCSKASAFHATQYLAAHGLAERATDGTWTRTAKSPEEVDTVADDSSGNNARPAAT